jgi:Uma2 family endonuclease
MSSPKYIPHYSIDDYRTWEGDWELWEGIAVAMKPSPFGKHQKLLTRLAQRFLNAIERSGCADCQVVVELDWIIDQETVVRPDLSIVCGADLDRFIEDTPVLIVEVLSDSTRHKDQTAKLKLYEMQGVRYYLLADPETNTSRGYELNDRRYDAIAIDSPYAFQLHDDCRISVGLATSH